MAMDKASAQYFSQVAGEWDTIQAGYFDHSVRNAAFERAGLNTQMIAADIGAGTGYVTAGLAPLVRLVHVVDGSAEMLAVAQKNLARFPNLEFHMAEGLALPLPDHSLDVAFANMYLHHIIQPMQAIQEIVRTLKTGGMLVISDMDTHPYTWFKDEMADVWLGFERSQMAAWLEQAGLRDVLVDCSNTSCSAASSSDHASDQRSKATVSIFLASGIKAT